MIVFKIKTKVNKMLKVKDVRWLFDNLKRQNKCTSVNREASMTNIMGSKTIELVGQSFIADENSIFGKVNEDYIRREEEWYRSQSLNINDIPGGAPAVWKAVADKDGFINSNYGWCVFSKENNSQFEKVVNELKKNPESRRAVIIYTRPTMWDEYNLNGRSDFMCTNTVQYLIRDEVVHCIVQMRSNDAVFGYKNDRAWHLTVLGDVAKELNLPIGNIYWQVGSLHVYERHFHLIECSSEYSDEDLKFYQYM
jgi:thymidylate synthase